MDREKTKSIVLCALFTALTAAGAFLKIPIPVLPITLQTLFVMLAGLLLGSRRGALSVLAYIILGLLGLPIFAQGGGLLYVLQPSFGYIIGFAAGAWLTGKIAEGGGGRPGYGRLLVANFAGLGVIYLFGMVYYFCISNFYLGKPMGLWPLFLYCFLMTIPGDILLSFLAAAVARRLIPLTWEGRPAAQPEGTGENT